MPATGRKQIHGYRRQRVARGTETRAPSAGLGQSKRSLRGETQEEMHGPQGHTRGHHMRAPGEACQMWERAHTQTHAAGHGECQRQEGKRPGRELTKVGFARAMLESLGQNPRCPRGECQE